MEKYNMLIEYLMSTVGFNGHSSKGEPISICISIVNVKLISELSHLIGKMEMAKIHNDTDNFNSLEFIFNNKCEDSCIDMEDFNNWLNDNLA